jgi:three-Cys-motif partner protein
VITHRFGGDWTEDKLTVLRKYLNAYTSALSNQTWCRKMYVDAFAGTGHREAKREIEQTISELTETETQEFLKGSATIALETEPPFDRYLFVERKKKHVLELENLKTQFPKQSDRIIIENAEANTYLRDWQATIDWNQWRAVVFLDPYGMQVDWETLQELAKARGIDLWLLFPIGQAVNRVLTTREPPPEHWANALNRTFGTDEWLSEFYPTPKVPNLLGEYEQTKVAGFDRIAAYFIRRLETIFPAVAQNPLLLRNSQNTPLYLLCFASANPGRGGQLAVKIAQDILKI